MSCLSKICASGILIGLMIAWGALCTLENVPVGDPEPVGAWITLAVGFLLIAVSLFITFTREDVYDD